MNFPQSTERSVIKLKGDGAVVNLSSKPQCLCVWAEGKQEGIFPRKKGEKMQRGKLRQSSNTYINTRL